MKSEVVLQECDVSATGASAMLSCDRNICQRFYAEKRVYFYVRRYMYTDVSYNFPPIAHIPHEQQSGWIFCEEKWFMVHVWG